MGGPVAHPPDDAVGQKASQGAVDSRVGLAEDACQLCRVDERHSAKGVEQLSFGERHVSSITEQRSGQKPIFIPSGRVSGFQDYIL